MTLKFFLFFVPIFFLSFLDLAELTKRDKSIVFIIVCIYILGFTFLIINHSGDYINYELFYNEMNSIDNYYPTPNYITNRYEPGFAMLNLVVNKITTNPYIGIYIITAIGLIIFFYQFPKYSTAIFLMMAIYIGHFYWWFGLVLIRQILAMAILLPVIYLSYNKKYFKIIICILAAISFHYSAIFFLLLFPFFNLRISSVIIIMIVFASFIFGFFNLFELIALYILQYIPRGDIFIDYLMYNRVSLNILFYVEMILILLISLLYKQKLLYYNKYTGIAINYLLVAIITAGLFQHYEIVSRYANYFCFGAYLIILPTLSTIFKNMRSKIIYYILLNTYLLIFLTRLITSLNLS